MKVEIHKKLLSLIGIVTLIGAPSLFAASMKVTHSTIADILTITNISTGSGDSMVNDSLGQARLSDTYTSSSNSIDGSTSSTSDSNTSEGGNTKKSELCTSSNTQNDVSNSITAGTTLQNRYL
jgi:hypothetical protein